MQKSKKYDWKDSNVELIGTKEDRMVKKASAETEPAWNKAKAGNQPELFIWRIEKFKVVEWPKKQFGEFYEGDSYIVLNIYKRENELLYDVHFWIGKYSTQDEYGTAAYKTVELDNLLDDKPVQHREVQHYESEMFKSYFPQLVYLKGGCESGFRHVNTREYSPRLLHFRGERRNIVVSEVSATKRNLRSDDVFIYDTGTHVFEWIGKGANKDEKFKAQQFAQQLNTDRNGKAKIEVLDEADISPSHEFYKNLSDSAPDDEDKQQHKLSAGEKKLFKISDATGSLKFEKVAVGNFSKSAVNEEDVFIVDNGQVIYVYIGEKASHNERQNALIYAHNYLKSTEYPQAPVTVMKKDVKGQNADEFNKVLSG